MKKKITALLAALAVSATMMPMYTVVNAAGSESLATVLADYANAWNGANPNYKFEDDIIKTTGDVEVAADMKAAEAGETLTDKVAKNTYDADTTLNKQMKFDYATTLKMSSVLAEYNNVTSLAKSAIAVECMNDTDEGARQTELEAQLAKSYIENAEFTVTYYSIFRVYVKWF